MKHPQYFRDWIGNWKWGARIALFLILMSSLIQFGIFAMTQSYMMSLLGLQTEDVSFAMQISYVGILATIPVQFRFMRCFETRTYLMFNIITGILLSVCCILNKDITLFYMIRFLQGIVVCNIAGGMVGLIYSRLKTEQMQAIGSTVFYGSIFSNGVLIGIVAAIVMNTADLSRVYYYSIIFQVLSLFIAYVTLSPKSGHRRYPLFQMDWIGVFLFALAAAAMCYTMIYGSRYYWFRDQRIVCSACLAVLSISSFIFRQLTIKRPLMDLSIFKSRNFIIGLLLLATYNGFKDSINIIYSYTGAVLQWSPEKLMLLGAVNIIGVLFFMILSAQLMIRNRHSIKGFLLSGFGLMVLYHLWMYFIFTPNLSFMNLVIPVLLQGSASGLLFVPIVIFTLSSAPRHTGTTGIVIAACARFSATLNSIPGFYNLQLFFNKQHKLGILNRISELDFETTARIESYTQMFKSKGYTTEQATAIAYSTLGRALDTQTQLLTNRSIFLMIAMVLSAVIFLILVIPSLHKTTLRFNKRMFTNGR